MKNKKNIKRKQLGFNDLKPSWQGALNLLLAAATLGYIWFGIWFVYLAITH